MNHIAFQFHAIQARRTKSKHRVLAYPLLTVRSAHEMSAQLSRSALDCRKAMCLQGRQGNTRWRVRRISKRASRPRSLSDSSSSTLGILMWQWPLSTWIASLVFPIPNCLFADACKIVKPRCSNPVTRKKQLQAKYITDKWTGNAWHCLSALIHRGS